jgi:pimeloyl-ACP methyl ester carboxylesterase
MTDQRAVQQEAAAIGELAALHRDPVFYGRGVERGDRRAVLVVPGLFGNDLYLQPLRVWLMRIGYTPVRSSLAVNAGCGLRLMDTVERSLGRHLAKDDAPLALIGHSRGGMLCWALAARLQTRASHLILLGSPAPAIVGMLRQRQAVVPASVAHSSVAAAGARAVKWLDPDCAFPDCGCSYVEELRRPLHRDTRVLSVFSKDDTIVAPGASRVPGATNVEVGGTHSGLAYNRAVYPHIARFLARR